MSLLRRRGLARKSVATTWHPLSGNAMASWAKSARVTFSGDTVTLSPNAYDWNTTFSTNNLNYQYQTIENWRLHISFDFTIQNGTQDGFVVSVFTFSAKNPPYNSTRIAQGSIVTARTAEGSIDVTVPVKGSLTSGTINKTNFYGVRCYAHSGANSVVTIKNLKLEVAP